MRLLTLVLVLLLSGCSLLNPDKGEPDFEATPPPEVGTPDASGKVAYLPSFDRPELKPDNLGSEVSEHCRVFEQTEDVGPEEVKTSIFQGAYKTVGFERTEPPLPVVQTADHVHLTGMTVTAVAGDDFSFLSWMEAYLSTRGLPNKLVAWGADLDSSGYVLELEIDGQTDLIAYVQDDITLKGELRAQYPSTKTWITAEVSFLIFTDCEWY